MTTPKRKAQNREHQAKYRTNNQATLKQLLVLVEKLFAEVVKLREEYKKGKL